MFARTVIPSPRHALALRWLALLLCVTPLVRAQEPAPPVPLVSGTSIAETNRVVQPPARPASPLPPAKKRRAGFLAGTGLVILSLLVLVAGLALVRTFKR